jgi:apolipoprotein D and lipocalin family protein
MPARRACSLLAAAALTACAGAPTLPTAARVDLPRFMGDWYVLAAIPASQEANAFNAVESYRLRPGTTDVVETTYAFRDGAFDGPLVTLTPVGFVKPGGGAEWGMKFWWWQGPFRLEYLVAHVDDGYRETIIGRSKRDLVWIMARTPEVPEADYRRLVAQVGDLGYDVARLRRVPHRWGEGLDRSPSERAQAPARAPGGPRP